MQRIDTDGLAQQGFTLIELLLVCLLSALLASGALLTLPVLNTLMAQHVLQEASLLFHLADRQAQLRQQDMIIACDAVNNTMIVTPRQPLAKETQRMDLGQFFQLQCPDQIVFMPNHINNQDIHIKAGGQRAIVITQHLSTEDYFDVSD